eukprot:CAMPEP_0196587290 /NCGR_PEP_ID=MMETSP1081-20130531/57028_1 /TAXON_ID=36882 /ORGANISM="Pyramimonas amylifera, Strain CCMP720" /LENGTH=217 /DNA_ID=CAMNT_0041909435 /DNA_START=158 /DNA_END=811 /DNA_ORIENTATION=-
MFSNANSDQQFNPEVVAPRHLARIALTKRPRTEMIVSELPSCSRHATLTILRRKKDRYNTHTKSTPNNALVSAASTFGGSYSNDSFTGSVQRWWGKTESTPENVTELICSKNFMATINTENSRVVVVEVFAGWCAACRSLNPKLNKIAHSEFPNALFLKINMDDHPELTQELGVDKLPSFLVYKNSDLVSQFTASLSYQGLKRLRSNIGNLYFPLPN